MDDADDSQGLLKSMLGFFARKRPERSAQPQSLRSRTREAWVRTDSFSLLQHDDFDEMDPATLARTLRALEDYIQDDSGLELDSVSALDIQQTPFFSASEAVGGYLRACRNLNITQSNARPRSRAPNNVGSIESFRPSAA